MTRRSNLTGIAVLRGRSALGVVYLANNAIKDDVDSAPSALHCTFLTSSIFYPLCTGQKILWIYVYPT